MPPSACRCSTSTGRFGKHFARNEALYRKGWQGLAYEIVINSDPCICYIMEENSATMQTLVHRARRLRPQPLLQEQLRVQAVDRRRRHPRLSRLRQELHRQVRGALRRRGGRARCSMRRMRCRATASTAIPASARRTCAREERRERERRAARRAAVQRPLAHRAAGKAQEAAARRTEEERRRALLQLPEENILYFLEKTAPRLQPWQREILRIVRLIAQYFYPQRQTKMMNEGCATCDAPPHHEAAAREGSDRRRRLSGIPALAHQRGDAAGLRRPPLFAASTPMRSASP